MKTGSKIIKVSLLLLVMHRNTEKHKLIMIKNCEDIKTKTLTCDLIPLSSSTMCTGFANKESHYQTTENRAGQVK